MKLRFKINFRLTSKILDIYFRLSNKKETEPNTNDEVDDMYDEPGDPDNGPSEDNSPGWFDDDSDEYDDDSGLLNWPPTNYN